MTFASLSAVGGNPGLKLPTQLMSTPAERIVAPRILAIDYGRKRIGLAISDELGMTAQPLQVLAHKNRREDVRRLRDICRAKCVRLIVVGHPVHITGEAGEMANETARFATRLRKELGIEVELADERLTTWEAEQTLAEMGGAKRRKDAPLDDVAAAILLREYLERRSANREGKE